MLIVSEIFAQSDGACGARRYLKKGLGGGVSHRALRKAGGMDIRRIDEEGGIEAELGLKIFSFAPAAGLNFERLFKRWKLLRPDRAPQIMCPAKILRAGAKIFELACNPNKFHRKASPKAVWAPNLFSTALLQNRRFPMRRGICVSARKNVRRFPKGVCS